MKILTKFLLFMLLISTSLSAQIGRGKLTASEYYWDTDPGQGLGIALSLQGNLNDGIRSAVQTSTNNLSAGLHTFNIRMRDSIGNWGPTFTTALSVENALSARSISASFARVYWDNDIAGATPLIIFNGNIANTINSFIQSSPINTFSNSGLHTLNIQVMDNGGHFSPPFTSVVSIENIKTARTLSASFARVYWDGNTANSIGLIFLNGNATNAINTFIESSPIATFGTSGLHTLSVEVMDNTGHYSQPFTTVIAVDAELEVERSIKVTDGRVWFDTNVPALPNMLAFDGNFNSAIETALKSLASPAQGLHTINVQLRDSANGWGPTFTTTLSVEGPIAYRNINVSEGQLFWDNDTTLNATTLLAFDGAFENAIESAYSNSLPLLNAGLHSLHIRVKDVAGNWGKAFTTAITIENPIAVRDLKITEGEVSLDNNPAIAVIGMNGNFSNALEQAQATLISVGVPIGLHKLNVRMKGRDNNWGPYFTTAILVSPCASTPTPVITAQRPLSFCFGDSTILVAPSGYNSYQWVTNNTVVSTAESIKVSNSGSYIVIVTDATNCPGASPSVVVDMHNPVVSISSNAAFCQGTVDSLSATSGFNSYLWSTGSTSSKIGVSTGGTYTVTVSDLLGCTGTNSSTINILSQPPTPIITSNGPLSFCPGNNVTLSCNSSGNLLWSIGQTTSSITTDTSGTYQIVVTNANGCSSSSAITTTLKFNQAQANITANGPTTICADTFVGLTANLSASYTWSNGVTTQFNNINTSGNYSVAIVDSNGCEATSNVISIIVNPLPATPIVSANGPLNFCNGNAVTLTSSSLINNLWNNGSTSSTQIVTQSGTYVDTVFNQYGCKAWSIPTLVDVHPVATITSNKPLTFCADDDVTLTAHPNSGVNYLWFNGSTSQSVTLNTQTDSAWVIVTEIVGGCSDTVSVKVNVNPLPIGIITADGPTVFCSGNSVTFNTSGDPHTKFQWYQNGQPLMYAVWNIYSNSYNYYHVEGYSFSATSSGSYSAMTIDTLTGCSLMSNTINVIVNSAPQPVISANGGTTLCIGANTILSSTSAASYLWSTGANTQQITSSISGYYTVTITDNNGCTNTSIPTFVSFYPTASISSNGPTTFCVGENVNLTAQPIGTYLWSNGSTSASINNITSPGTYIVSITDVNGCSSISAPVSIVVNPLPNGTIGISGSTTVCQGDYATLTTNVDPHTKVYWYQNGQPLLYAVWNIYSNSYNYYNVQGYSYNAYSTGIYSAQVIDTLTGCSQMTNGISINVVPLPLVNISQTSSILCFGGNEASLTATGIGTVSPYSFNWNTGLNTASISSLTAGTYSVTVTDNIGCMSDSTFTITQPTSVSPSLYSPANTRGFNTSCFGIADGSISVTAGGTPPYSYLWSNSATTSSLMNIGAGTYTVTVTDANGCTGISTITLSEPPPVTLNLTTATYIGGNEIRCFGERGFITAQPAGGTGPFTFVWSDGQNTQTADTLFAGSYTVVASDSEGCSISKSFTLHQPDKLLNPLTAIDHNGYNISCYGNSDGEITTNVVGGNGGYQYWWNDSITTQNRIGLPADTFTVLVTDTNGCQSLDSIILTEPTQILTQSIGSTLNCYGDSNGTASVLANGGNPGYSYLWSNNSVDVSISNLTAALYTVTVTDSRGCTKLDTTSVLQPPQLQAYAFGTYIGCGSQIGLLSGSATGGVEPYSYLWSNGVTADYQINLPVGNYSLTVTDSHGCLDTAYTIILNPPVLVSSFTAISDSINTVLSITVSGGVTPYMYLWSDGTNTPTDTIPNNHPSGVYSVIVTDANGCTSMGSQFIPGTGCSLNAVLNATNVSCKNGSNGSITATINGAIGSVSYLWSPGGQTSSSIAGLNAGKYYLQVTDSIGCVYLDSILVNEPDLIEVTATPNSPIICNGGNSNVTVSAVGGTLPYTSGIGTFIQGAGSANYTVVDNNGCIGTSTITLINPPLLQASISASMDTICSNESVVITFTGPENGSVNYQIGNGNAVILNLDASGNASITLNGLTTTTNVNLIQVDSLVCSNSLSQSISIFVNPSITWYLDADHDGYYNGLTVTGCSAPSSDYSSTVLSLDIDCNDNNQDVHPFAIEICNLVDDNCNGQIDENGTNVYYADVDGDGFGAGTPINACTQPLNTSINNNDCNDSEISINPNAIEVCGNGIDDNCDLVIDEGCGCLFPPTSSAGFDQSICGNDNVNLYGAIGGSATTGIWTTSGTGTFNPNASTLNAVYIPSNADRISGMITLTLTTNATLTCAASVDAIDVFFGNKPIGALAINGPLTLCYPTPNAQFTYSVNPVIGASYYTWTVPANTTIVSGQGTNSITLSWNFVQIHNGILGNLSVQANNVNGCGMSDPSSSRLSVQLVPPVTPGSISGPLKVCPGDPVQTFSIAEVARAHSYTWAAPTGITILTGQGTNIITASIGAGFIGGNMTVIANNGCGSSPARIRTLFLNNLPAPVSIIGFTNGVCNSSGATYSIGAPVAGALSYAWTTPANVSIQSSTPNGSSITVNFLPGYTTGNFSVAAVNNCGTGTARTLTVNGAPATPGIITGTTNVCWNSINMYSVTTVTGTNSYNWLTSSSSTLQIQPSSAVGVGQGNKNVEIRGAILASGQSIAVNASNACGSSRNANLTGVTIISCPRVGTDESSIEVSMYPNPVSDLLNLSFQSDSEDNYSLMMYDATGRLVFTQTGSSTIGLNQFTLNVKELPSGIYSLSFKIGETSSQSKIVVE